MIDKRTEDNIKDVKSFLESWVKFHQIYVNLISKNTVTKDDERVFFETKDIISTRYSVLSGALEFKYMPYNRLSDPIAEILNLDNISYMSEKRMKKIEDDWNDSYMFLNKILERLKSRRKRLENFSAIGVGIKKLIERILPQNRGGDDD